ncbi:phosphoesterase [Jimgerdemannia flammicorona]|uniref:Phosphoesterase n=1 Tax=Jimgerdemannia flammicorona TaxID=994334 RepID=A0A433BYG6_9FUNG|nr:phosphoesterase [Jimgerdemannia flammicorona]
MKSLKSIFQIGVVFAAIVQVSVAGPVRKPSAPIARDANKIIKGKNFDRFVVIVLENTDYDDALKQPYLGSLGNRDNAVLLTEYSAVTHPSQPNYIAMIKGNTHGVFFDFDSTLSDRTIVDLLEDKHISWKSYAENYSGGCKLDSKQDHGLYARKHVPFVSFTTITSNPARCANIVPATQLDDDIANNAVPQFVFYTPNMKDDGHDTNTDTAAKWLESFLEPRLKQSAFYDNTLILITFDEQENYISLHNHVYAALIGGAVKRSVRTDSNPYSHYSILKTVEENWDLGSLGQNDVDATPFVTKDNGLGDRIKNIVMVMMENRSFDKMAGYFKYSPDINGLTGKEYNLVNTSDPNSAKIYATMDASYIDPDDPNHGIDAVVEQIGIHHPQITGYPGSAFGPFKQNQLTMSGFVQNMIKTHNISTSDLPRIKHVINSFNPADIPVTHALAQNFAIIDHWYASVPGSTQPNRLFAHAATSHGETTTTAGNYLAGYPQKTIFNSLDDAGITWKNYFQQLPSTIVFQQVRKLGFVDNLKSYDHFLADAKTGTLPQYSFVDPTYEKFPS